MSLTTTAASAPPDEPGAVDRQALELMLDLTVHAEQALLGQILHCPTRTGTDVRFRALLRWGLQPGDFYRPYHQQVFAAMVRLAERDEPTTPQAVRAELGNDPHLPPKAAANGVPLAELLAAAADADMTVATVMVLESATRRQAVRWAIRLDQAAAGPAADDLTSLHEQINVIRQDAARWLRRWRDLPAGVLARLYAADDRGRTRPTTVVPEPPAGAEPAAAEELERDLLASIATYPHQLGDLSTWMRPEHLRVDWARELYQIALDRHASIAPIDVLTLSWLAWRHGLRADGHLVQLTSRGQPWGRHLAIQIHHQAVCGRARMVAIETAGTAAFTQVTPQELLQIIDLLLVGLQEYASPGPSAHTHNHVDAQVQQAVMPGTRAPSAVADPLPRTEEDAALDEQRRPRAA